ncbi:glycosyltransferase family 4 protein [Neorhodopirellula pilleata]|uniref:glycosyltransferase family 4 protein n=1 Tax=Neorhodopirellula pilleata TaxID=2714738 RepID=UPI0011B66DB4|nr:glycosyltransferase family 4 protein [Neorhodopirellula pilleata]
MKLVYLTAGAAGMYCGSCMHDNALARALIRRGHDVLLQPIYTPIRTDETDVSTTSVMFGGIHVYLLQRVPLLRYLPRSLRSWMDRPGLIRWATRRAVKTDPAQLGSLTLSMLRGRDGRQAEEVERMAEWLSRDVRPDAIVLSNLLIGGAIPEIARRLPDTRIIVILQGDDIFLDHLPDEARSEAIELCGELAKHVDMFITNSRFYQNKMGAMFGIDESKFVIHPLSIDLTAFEGDSTESSLLSPAIAKADGEFRIGYMARIAPEKGLHLLAEAFAHLAKDPTHDRITLHAAGWLGEHNEAYLRDIQARMRTAGLADRFVYHGSPDLAEKVRLMRSFDVMSVPSPYEDPKGLFVLESIAAGVPVVQPAHGAFPELIESTGGGECFTPEDHHDLASRLVSFYRDPTRRKRSIESARERLKSHHSIEVAAKRMEELIARGE